MGQVKNRIGYIDVAKAMGIFAIWLGHYGPDAGYAYLWVFYLACAIIFLYIRLHGSYGKNENNI